MMNKVSRQQTQGIEQPVGTFYKDGTRTVVSSLRIAHRNQHHSARLPGGAGDPAPADADRGRHGKDEAALRDPRRRRRLHGRDSRKGPRGRGPGHLASLQHRKRGCRENGHPRGPGPGDRDDGRRRPARPRRHPPAPGEAGVARHGRGGPHEGIRDQSAPRSGQQGV